MPRRGPPLPIPSVPVLRTLYKQQAKRPSVHAPAKRQLDHEYNLRKLAERPKLDPIYTKYFRLGHNEIHFPSASITLLRPFSSDYNPYRARFRVPSNFNKFDLRDYLHNIYGLTVKKVYSSLVEDRASRTMTKFMTVEMDEPFMYPKYPESLYPWRVDQIRETVNFLAETARRYGASTIDNKVMKAFEGVAQKRFPTIKPYVPRKTAKLLLRQAKQVDAFADASLKLKE
ncbi:mitochondrial 54S ribosomal protein uL23m [Limtongia smithiae]|uniref:mitochondrial 54S ribosomal protein uL23m n=1 Tax=Limtongia smithiae TaxID=1125753 RepID=UPI0034D00A86